jgi:hypothetical protein
MRKMFPFLPVRTSVLHACSSNPTPHLGKSSPY